MSVAIAGRGHRDQPVDVLDKRIASEAAAQSAKTVAGLEVFLPHRRLVVADVVVGLSEREMKQETLARRQTGSRQRCIHPRDQRAVAGGELPVGRDPVPHAWLMAGESSAARS